jgi:hypothetical protein
MINLLGCLTPSGAGTGAIAGSVLDGPREVAAPSVVDNQTGESGSGLLVRCQGRLGPSLQRCVVSAK